ncbi:MAG: AAA family ATPase, partial [Anaerolineales bacterium]|nr:AAA family ATPase [Anaerolineales bacterium]
LAREIAQRGSLSPAPYLPAPPPPSPGLDAAQIPLIGRADARAQLLAHVEALGAGCGGIALIEGEAGVGKTRLLQEIARDAEWRGAQVLWGHCQEPDTTAPYTPVIDALAQGLSSLRVEQLRGLLDPIWQQTLAPLLPNFAGTAIAPAPLDPKPARARLLEALAQLITAWTQITPLVVMVEDLHWVDNDTLDLLAHLALRLRDARALFIGTYRGEDARAQTVRWEKMQALDRAGLRGRIELKRLDMTATHELIRRALGLARAAPRFEERLYRETDGNPLFVLETLRTLRDEGLLARDAEGQWRTPWDETTRDYAEMPLPRAVERVIARRATQLAAPAQHILCAAAILGGDLDFALARAVGELETQQTLGALGELVQRRFLEETRDAYRFTHDKVRQVIYAGIAEPERRELHRRAGAALEQTHPDRVAALAHHFFEGALWEPAAQSNRQAGDRAARVYAHREAANHYTRALAARVHLTSLPHELFELYAARAAAYALLGERSAQADDLRALDELSHDPALDTPARRAHVALWWAEYYEATSDYPAAFASVERAAAQAQLTDDATTEYHAHLRWGRMSRQRGELASAREHFERAYTLAQTLDDPTAQAGTLNDLGVVFHESQDFHAALTHYQRALAACQATNDQATLAGIHNSLGNFYHITADFAAAREHHQRALALRRAMGDRRNEAGSLYNLSLVYHDSGDNEAARHTLEQVCELTHAIGDRRIEGYGWVYLGLVLEYLCEWDAAHAAYTTGLALRREVGLHALAIDALAGLARVATARGDHANAVAYADQVLAWLNERGVAGVGDPLLAYLGAYRALFAAGETARAMAALQTAYDLLVTQAATIPDEERRRAFLHDISPGKHIWNDYHTRVESARPRLARVRLPRADAPTGRALRDDEYIEIVWTIAATEDDAIADKAERRQHRLARLLAEAHAQGAAPTHAQLADALGVGVRTVERDMGRMRDEG